MNELKFVLVCERHLRVSRASWIEDKQLVFDTWFDDDSSSGSSRHIAVQTNECCFITFTHNRCDLEELDDNTNKKFEIKCLCTKPGEAGV